MISVFWTSVLALSSIVVAILWQKRRRINRLTENIPGPEAVPIFGNSLQFPTDSAGFYRYLEALCTTYKDSGLYRLWFGSCLAVVIYRADFLEPLFNSSKHMNKTIFYKILHPWLKLGLLNSTGEKWRVRRKMITPTFHFKILQEFLAVMNEQTEIMINLLDAKAEQGPFDIEPYIAHCAQDIICETAMGCHVNAQTEQSEYSQAAARASEEAISRLRQPWLWPDFVFWCSPLGRRHNRTLKTLHGFSRKVILERNAEFDRQWKKRESEKNETATTEDDAIGIPIRIGKRMAFLDVLLWNAKKDSSIDFDGIHEEVDTFMFEGEDTTATTTIWTLYFIGQYPEVQKRLQQEVDEIFGDSDRSVTTDDLSRLKYLECVYKETMRLRSTVPYFGRELSEDCEIGGYCVPKGTNVLVMSIPLHRDPKYFPDPDKFDPDRWYGENPTDKNPFCYVPFSAGLRNCIGQKFAVMELKVLLSGILRRFDIRCSEAEKIERVALLVLRTSTALRIELSRRRH